MSTSVYINEAKYTAERLENTTRYSVFCQPEGYEQAREVATVERKEFSDWGHFWQLVDVDDEDCREEEIFFSNLKTALYGVSDALSMI